MMLYLRDAREAPADWRLTLFSTHGAMAWSIAQIPRPAWPLALLCAAGRVDLCHINLASRGSTFRKACLRGAVPAVPHALCRPFHGGGYREFFARRSPAGKAIIRSLFLGAGRVIVLGSLWRDFVHDEIGVPQARIVILANAVEGPEKIVEAERVSPPSILFLGLLRREKGIEVLLEALAKPALGACEWRAVLAGNGDVAKYAADVASLGLSERISLPGWCAQDTGAFAAAPEQHSGVAVLRRESAARLARSDGVRALPGGHACRRHSRCRAGREERVDCSGGRCRRACPRARSGAEGILVARIVGKKRARDL